MSTTTKDSWIASGHDRISNLPECVISHILSRLPTKDAVRTSVLSKDWEYKWTFSYDIEIDDRQAVSYNESNKASFAKFVDRTLHLSQYLQLLRLSCRRKYDLNRMKKWISAALSHNIHTLDICYPHEVHIILPSNLISCYSLRKLELAITCTFKVPAEICFPHLKFLKLESVIIFNELPVYDVVKFNLPVVETFELRFCKWFNVKFVEIYVPKMTRFEFAVPDDVNDYSIKIIGDSPVKFKYVGGLPEKLVLSGGLEIVYADLYHHVFTGGLYNTKNCGKRFLELLNGFLSLQELRLSYFVTKAIALAGPRLSLPKYYKMERLVMYSLSSTQVLLKLLHAAPNLKLLEIESGVTDWNDCHYGAEECVPLCIVSHLEEVEFKKFGGKMSEMKLAKFFLKNALQLKRLRVCSYPDPPTPRYVYFEFMRYPKASACVTIHVA